MEDMNIDDVVDIPDTPDRLVVRRTNGVQLGKGINSSAASHLRNSCVMNEGCLNWPKARSRLVSENGHNRSLHLHPQRKPINVDELGPHNNSRASSEHVYPSQNALLFRRAATFNNSKSETKRSLGLQHMDKGKTVCANIPYKSPVCNEDNAFLDLTKQNESNGISNKDFPCSASKDLQAEEIKEGLISSNRGSSLHFQPISSRISGNASKGKEKIDHGNGIDLCGGTLKNEKQMSASHLSVTSPRFTGRKRLVRNGCISPQNIASRAQKSSHEDGSTNVHSRNMASDGPSQVDIREIVAENDVFGRAKGKGVIIHPSTSKEHGAKITNVSTSSVIDNKAASDASRDSLLGGWRSTHNHANLLPCSRLSGRDDGKDNGRGNVSGDAGEHEDQDAGKTASKRVSRFNHRSEPHHVENNLTKRQKKPGSISRNHGECSTMVPEDSEIMFLGSSLKSSSSRSSRIQNNQHQGILDPIYEVDELSSETRNGNSQVVCSLNNEVADAKARQVEADEMLARELQEQLYHEAPIFEGSNIDENIAWTLQREEGAFIAASRHNYPVSRRSHRQTQPRSSNNNSNRRRTQVRVPTTRTQLRHRLFRDRNPSPAGSSRGRNFQFPLGMDLDTRLDILEALEAAVEDLNDMDMMASNILQVQRDFNENDYEMLLALDENNRQCGASVNQINNLPESVVQTDNFEEACAICLETPTTGETIRHLPCLHKFHKDCIDPWLSRRTSCPVCKSPIT